MALAWGKDALRSRSELKLKVPSLRLASVTGEKKPG